MAKTKENLRVPTEQLHALMTTAVKACQEARAALESQFPRLSKEDREAAAKPPNGFPKAARKIVQASSEFADVVTAARFDKEAVVEDIDNLDLLYPLQREVDLLKTVTDDAVLLSGDEAYREVLGLYNVAKAIAGVRPEVEELVKTTGTLFSTVRAKTNGSGSAEE